MTCNLKYYDLSFLYDKPPLTSYQITLIKYKRVIDIIIEYASLLQISHKDCFIIFKGQILDNFENISNLNLENKSLLFVYNDKHNKQENKKNKSLVDLMNSIFNTYSPNTNIETTIDSNVVNNLLETTNINFNSVIQEEIEEEEISIDEEFENQEDQEFENQEDSEIQNQIGEETQNQENNTNENLFQKYFQQMQEMKAMGFTDIFKNIEALIVTNGDIQLAVNYLIQSDE